MLRQFIQWIVIGSLLLLLLAWWRVDALPPSSELGALLLDEPVQTAIKQAAFEVDSGGVTYTVQPLYDYDLVGLVVSKHDANAWWDYLHREWNDSLNITDLCVVWGNNVRSGSYADISFSSGQFTCNFSTHSDAAFAAFDQTAISNNHLLTDNPQLAKAMRAVRIGDQIHFHGRLSEYSHHQGFNFKRGTSITRSDTGNGACETVFVDQFEILKKGGKPWRALMWVAGVMLALGVFAWIRQPVRFNDTH
jgi:hypothetical protein